MFIEMVMKYIYEGYYYKFKKNSMNKLTKRYYNTYNYVLNKILKYKKYQKLFNKELNILINTNNKINYLITILESTAIDFNLDNDKVYSYKSFNKEIIKGLKKSLKEEKRYGKCLNINSLETYKKIINKNDEELRELAFNKPNEFLQGLYLYTICED